MSIAVTYSNTTLDGAKPRNGFFISCSPEKYTVTRGQALQRIESFKRFADKTGTWFHVSADVRDQQTASYVDITLRTFPAQLGFDSKRDFVKSVAGRLGVEEKELDEIDEAFARHP